VRRSLVIPAIGLAMAASLLTPAAARAGRTPSASAHVVTANSASYGKLRPGAKLTRTVLHGTLGKGADPVVNCTGTALIDEHHGTALWAFIPGNGNNYVYFDNSGGATYFCDTELMVGNMVVGFQFFVDGTNVCLALNSTAHAIWEGSATACGSAALYTVWNLYTTSDPNYYLYQSDYTGQPCIYDNTQRPATYATCNDANQFEWLNFA
jgi:hypothetical protein